MNLCHICGNEIRRGVKNCTFCGSEQKENHQEQKVKKFVHRTVNLEAGMPLVEPALQQLHAAVHEARIRDIQVLTIIHGYGSTGRGGAIRRECRKVLEYMKSRGELGGVIAGEEFYRRNGPVRDLLKRYPQLEKNNNLNRGNKGITLVIM
ncbi:Smr/MutS family protein [Desulfopila aestuarii]|uniref:Smr domain-containing protein n=1 Tax=Desulfopila aestuarii DSM 18488 TaxID=1121416 RepID=A0A1M7Y016_9BACT|nr:Smr/MutS family protein [Desulfopila aestuarii]SHO44866.1 Smr domain-containing protein [Desulfopila aestuarii DSM 18488]